MSHARVDSKAITLLPLMVTDSFSSQSRWISSASRARKTSPEPLTFMRDIPSPVKAFFSILLTPPLPS